MSWGLVEQFGLPVILRQRRVSDAEHKIGCGLGWWPRYRILKVGNWLEAMANRRGSGLSYSSGGAATLHT